MTKSGHDECKAIFHCGKFHVIGGYSTEMQGRFERSAEAFDVATWRWDQVAENFLESAMCPRTCMDGDDERIFMCRDGDVVVQGLLKQEAHGALPILQFKHNNIRISALKFPHHINEKSTGKNDQKAIFPP